MYSVRTYSFSLQASGFGGERYIWFYQYLQKKNGLKAYGDRDVHTMQVVCRQGEKICTRHLAAFVFVPSVLGEKFPTAEF